MADNRWGIALAVSLGALLEVIDTSIVNVALPEMETSLGATLSEVSWVVTSYVVANVIILTLAAWLGDTFGKKRYFIFSLVAFTAASVACGLAVNLPMLIAARVVQGLCGGGLLTKAQSLLFQTFTKKEDQAMAQGLFGTIVIAGPAIGPTLGGWLVTHAGWRWIFFVNLPVGIIATFLCVAFLPADDSTGHAKTKVDWVAVGLLTMGLGSFQVVLEEGQSHDWLESPFVRRFAICAAIGLAVFVWRVLTSPRPIVDLRVLRHRALWAGSILSVVVGIGLYGTLFAIPIFAQEILHFTAEQTGMLLIPGALVSAFAMPIAAKLIAKFDVRILLVGGIFLLGYALYDLSYLSPLTGEKDLFWPLIVRAFAIALVFLPLNMATLGSLPPKDIPAASGIFSLTRQLGASIGVASLTTILVQRHAFHRAVLVEKLVAGTPETVAHLDIMAANLVTRGSDLVKAHQSALAILDRRVDVQAAVMSFGDTFWLTLVLFAVTLPLVLLLGKAGGASAGPAH
ncbi:DHA2 family efflux MFS transporter permease subunit [Pendulispora brunnea]|uniref:DHA2 family efflux MFS transporter permease subunit n=1 Tax=Pendulispora brunnea TaxID=2905690 RepID=A0ABZ2JYD4_9BACT